MRFDYNSLFKADKEHQQIGNWSGFPVYAMGKDSLRQKAEVGKYYIVYDDDNLLVTKMKNGNYYSRGKVNVDGNVWDYDSRPYELPKELNKPKEINMGNRREYTYTSKKEEVRVELNIDDYLKEMKNVTVEDMLVGVRGADY